MHRKPNLPEKTCAVCGRPFGWRRKWAKVWDEVRYCSDRCRRARSSQRTEPCLQTHQRASAARCSPPFGPDEHSS